MSKKEQAEAYIHEAELTLKSAKAIYDSSASGERMWAQAVKNAYDAMEQAASAGLAHREKRIPRSHTAKIKSFVDLYDLTEELSGNIFHWLGERSDSQYVDVRGEEIVIPHELFDQEDAERILKDAEKIIKLVKRKMEKK